MTIRSATRSFCLAAVLSGSAVVAGCNDDPFGILNWSADPDTAVIFSLARPELNLPSGFDFALRQPIEIQDATPPGEWDVLLDTRDGELVFLVPAFFQIDSDARVAVMEGRRFDDVRRAPEDTVSFIGNAPIPIRMGNTYVIQTHLAPDRFGQQCHFFAKMEPLSLSVERGTLEFVFDRNPLCEDLDLVPPEDGN